MTAFFDKLNLRPGERRLVVAVVAIVFVLLNFWFVQPHFKDWARLQKDLATARATLETYRAAVDRLPKTKAALQQLAGAGAAVLPAEQALTFTRAVQGLAAENQVLIQSTRMAPPSASSKTNQFFEEQALTINVNTRDDALINFLLACGTNSSMIRVRDLTLRPDPSQTRLIGDLTLIASYQKNVKPAAPSPGPVAAATTKTNEPKKP